MTAFNKMCAAIAASAHKLDPLDARALTVAWATYTERLENAVLTFRSAHAELREAERDLATVTNTGDDDD